MDTPARLPDPRRTQQGPRRDERPLRGLVTVREGRRRVSTGRPALLPVARECNSRRSRSIARPERLCVRRPSVVLSQRSLSRSLSLSSLRSFGSSARSLCPPSASPLSARPAPSPSTRPSLLVDFRPASRRTRVVHPLFRLSTRSLQPARCTLLCPSPSSRSSRPPSRPLLSRQPVRRRLCRPQPCIHASLTCRRGLYRPRRARRRVQGRIPVPLRRPAAEQRVPLQGRAVHVPWVSFSLLHPRTKTDKRRAECYPGYQDLGNRCVKPSRTTYYPAPTTTTTTTTSAAVFPSATFIPNAVSLAGVTGFAGNNSSACRFRLPFAARAFADPQFRDRRHPLLVPHEQHGRQHQRTLVVRINLGVSCHLSPSFSLALTLSAFYRH